MVNTDQLFETLLNSEGFVNLDAIEKLLRPKGNSHHGVLLNSLLQNNSLRILQKDMEMLDLVPQTHPLGNIIHAQELAKSRGSNIYVACMPKSGSSYFATTIAKGLDYKFALTTSSRINNPSNFGINGREQELCELAIIKKILMNQKKGLIAQHHTKACSYTAKTLLAYNFKLIVLIRNIFDIIVSADEMLKKYDMGNPSNQGFRILPSKFNSMDKQVRYELLAKTTGVFCIEFYLSWLRQKEMGTEFLEVNYDEEIALDKGNKLLLAKKVAQFLDLDNSNTKNLKKTFSERKINEKTARFNKGTTNQGQKISSKTKKFLIDYAKSFGSDLSTNDMEKLFGQSY